MISFFWFLIGFVAFFGTIISFWNFGHRGTWGEMIKSYRNYSPKFGKYLSGETIYFKNNDKWEGWNTCVVEVNSIHVLITQPYIIKWVIPSLKIPIEDVIVLAPIRLWMTKYIALGFKKNNCQLAIKASHLKEIKSARDRKIGTDHSFSRTSSEN